MFHVMSTWSPTLTFSSTAGSMTRRTYFHPFGPTKVMDDAILSMESIVAVIVLCKAVVPPGRTSCPATVVAIAVIDRCLARWLQSHDDVGVVGRLHLIPDLDFVEPRRALGHVQRHELAVGRLDVHAAPGMVDRLHGTLDGDRRCWQRFDLRPAGKEITKLNANAPRIAVFIRFMLLLLSVLPSSSMVSMVFLGPESNSPRRLHSRFEPIQRIRADASLAEKSTRR